VLRGGLTARTLGLMVSCTLLAAGCSSEPASIDALVQETCAGAGIDRAPSTVFAAAEARCRDDRLITWFASTADRDAWTTVAESVAASSGIPFIVLERGRYHVIHVEGVDLPLSSPRAESGTSASPEPSEAGRDAPSLLDPDGEPYFGTVRLRAGFPEDPHTVTLLAGGSVNQAGLPSGCLGNVGARPDVVIEYTAGSLPLNIVATSSADLTLVVRTPEGRVLCDDDTIGLDPAVLISTPSSGRYVVWVGTYGNDFEDATLLISELPVGRR